MSLWLIQDETKSSAFHTSFLCWQVSPRTELEPSLIAGVSFHTDTEKGGAQAVGDPRH